MTSSRIAVTAVWIAASLAVCPLGCQNADTVTGPRPNATPTRSVFTPIPSTPTPQPVTATPPPATATPLPATATPAPTPTALPADLSGSWSGTVGWRDLDWWWPCGDRKLTSNANEATAWLEQRGTTVAGTIHTACFEGRFDGNLVAHQLTGTVSWRRGFSQTGSATGTGTPRYIQLSVPWVDVSPCPDGICKVGGFQLILAR